MGQSRQHEQRIGFDHVAVWTTPPLRQVVRRTLQRMRGKRLPVPVDDLECGHVIADPGKAADHRWCSQCVPPRRLVRRPVSRAARAQALAILRRVQG